MVATVPEPSAEEIPENIQRLLRYPNVGLTNYGCPLSSCDERLVFTGTEHNDTTDDAGYIIGHTEREIFQCFADHRVYERGPELDINPTSSQ